MSPLVDLRSTTITFQVAAAVSAYIATAFVVRDTFRDLRGNGPVQATVSTPVQRLLWSRLAMFLVTCFALTGTIFFDTAYNSADLCARLVHFAPVYVVAKGCSYIVFFMKSRLVRPMSKWSVYEKLLFAVTLSVFAFAGVVIALCEGT